MRLLADENVHAEIVRKLRKAHIEILYVPEIGLAGCSDRAILEDAIKNDLILISGDKDFGGLIEFGALWGRGKVILLRYRIIDANRIVLDIKQVLNREADLIAQEKCFVLVLSESEYRIHRTKNQKQI
jgi:predicted nuclease of predicted toxin-antitoxin system